MATSLKNLVGEDRSRAQMHRVSQALQIWNGIRPYTDVPHLYARDVVTEFPILNEARGHDGVLGAMKAWHTTLAPFHISGTTVPGAMPNEVYLRWAVRGTFSSAFGEIQPTNKKIAVEGMTVFTFNDDLQIVHEKIIFDGDLLLKKMTGKVEDPQF